MLYLILCSLNWRNSNKRCLMDISDPQVIDLRMFIFELFVENVLNIFLLFIINCFLIFSNAVG